MTGLPTIQGQAELRAAWRESGALYWLVGVFSFFVNLLMLTGPLYMLNIYDRVLNSRSVETLIALTVLVAFLYAMMGTLDYVRGRVMARVGARFQARLDRRVFGAVLRAPGKSSTGLRDLEAVQRLITSPALMTMFDLPWSPLFFLCIFMFHPLMGLLALCGALVLLILALLNQFSSRAPLALASVASFAADQLGSQIWQESEVVQSLGMRDAAFSRWQSARGASLNANICAADAGGIYAALIKSFRLFLQSAMLGLGAYLVLQAELSLGAMIAGSILLGRALSPIEQIVGQWAIFQRGREGWRNLASLLTQIAPEVKRTPLPRPKARLSADRVTIVPPGESHAALRMISFDVSAGQAVGVIGTSGAGKSTLARALTGMWQPVSGKIKLDGAPLDQYDPDLLGQQIGYLPQRVQLFDGTIKDNIARMAMVPDDALVVAAAQKAGAHEMILQLPGGYDTSVTPTTGRLSGGQIQRIGLARALYGDPVMLVLDEPNSNLDNDGSLALNAAIRAFKAGGGIVFVIAHRPAAIAECDLLLVLENGLSRAFGPKHKVLAEVVNNHQQITCSAPQVVGMS
ncbi:MULTISPECIES: type I secretion system permease/ATPase [unclassified Yoonia]|uniref:type I secretion system permease/ATPase n=1 Tax=unclassified Yoonia TaxID=2629118 RepID=UPI002B0035DE|nr:MULTISPECIES: type I secretion system permease/ATPase [unclassified Yoonia]